MLLLPIVCMFLEDDREESSEVVEASMLVEQETPFNLANEYLGVLREAKEGITTLHETESVSKILDEVKKLGVVLEDIFRRAVAEPASTEIEEDEESEGGRIRGK